MYLKDRLKSLCIVLGMSCLSQQILSVSNTYRFHVYASSYAYLPTTCQGSELTFQRNSCSRLCFSHSFNCKGLQNYVTHYLTMQHEKLYQIRTLGDEKGFDCGTQTDSFRNLTIFLNTTSCSWFDVVCCQGLLQFACKKSSCRHKCFTKEKTLVTYYLLLPLLTLLSLSIFLPLITGSSGVAVVGY